MQSVTFRRVVHESGSGMCVLTLDFGGPCFSLAIYDKTIPNADIIRTFIVSSGMTIKLESSGGVVQYTFKRRDDIVEIGIYNMAGATVLSIPLPMIIGALLEMANVAESATHPAQKN